MFKKYPFALAVATFFLLGCTDKPKLHPLEGTSTDNPAAVVRIREGSMQLRGFDRKQIEISTIPNPFSNFVYVVPPGVHTLWGINIPGGHPLVPEGLRCYTISDVTLEPGVIYRLDESKADTTAILKREDTGAVIARGRLVDRKSAFTDYCKWE